MPELEPAQFNEPMVSVAPSLPGIRWHILITEPNREETAAKGLHARGFEGVYVPSLLKTVPAARSQVREVRRPLFPCYAFIPLPRYFSGSMGDICRVPGVFNFMMIGDASNRQIATLSEEAIAAIRSRESEIEGLRKGRLIKSPNGGIFEIGQQVSVPLPSAFTKLAGKIGSIAGKNVEVLLEMEFMGRKTITVDDRTLIAAGSS